MKRVVFVISLMVIFLAATPAVWTQASPHSKANYDLAAQWTYAEGGQAGVRRKRHAPLARIGRQVLVQLRNKPGTEVHHRRPGDQDEKTDLRQRPDGGDADEDHPQPL